MIYSVVVVIVEVRKGLISTKLFEDLDKLNLVKICHVGKILGSSRLSLLP